MSVNMNTITNKDAKMIYAKYWYKNMKMEMFPTIYIDKYWDYTINLFELNDDWNWFLERFNEEFKSAKEYIEESEKVKDILSLFIMVVSLFFIIPVCYVLYCQFRNKNERKMRKLMAKTN